MPEGIIDTRANPNFYEYLLGKTKTKNLIGDGVQGSFLADGESSEEYLPIEHLAKKQGMSKKWATFIHNSQERTD